MVSKKLLVGIVAVGCIAMSALSSTGPVYSDEPFYVQKDWGVVRSIEFVRNVKSSVYFKVETDKVVFDELDITDFPDGKLTIGDVIFMQNRVQPSKVKTSYCKNAMCQPVGTCYSWMPCFDEYEPLLVPVHTWKN